MTTAPVRPEKPSTPLDKVLTAPLDRLCIADVSAIVSKVMSVHLDQARIAAAKFSSFI
jgi:hypothetical protein